MQSDDVSLLFPQDVESDRQLDEEADEDLLLTAKKLNLDDEKDALIYCLRQGQAHFQVRELRFKGLSFQIWPAAHALCWYLEEIYGQSGMLKTCPSHLPTSAKCTFQKNMRVLELGAGTGMVGILCAMLGAHCTITDLPHVTPNLEYNATLNQEAIGRSGLGGSVVVEPLRWGESTDMEAVGCSFDLIVASDVVYYDHLFEPLLCTLKWLLCSPTCHMALCPEDGVVFTARSMANRSMGATSTNGVSISNSSMSEEGESSWIPTVKPVIDLPISLKEPIPAPLNISEDASILEEVPSLSINANAAAANVMHPAKETNCITSRPMPLIAVDETPVVLLAHLRRWKKDSHFFKKAAKLFHVTVVHKHLHDANSRTGVTVYRISRKKK